MRYLSFSKSQSAIHRWRKVWVLATVPMACFVVTLSLFLRLRRLNLVHRQIFAVSHHYTLVCHDFHNAGNNTFKHTPDLKVRLRQECPIPRFQSITEGTSGAVIPKITYFCALDHWPWQFSFIVGKRVADEFFFRSHQ